MVGGVISRGRGGEGGEWGGAKGMRGAVLVRQHDDIAVLSISFASVILFCRKIFCGFSGPAILRHCTAVVSCTPSKVPTSVYSILTS